MWHLLSLPLIYSSLMCDICYATPLFRPASATQTIINRLKFLFLGGNAIRTLFGHALQCQRVKSYFFFLFYFILKAVFGCLFLRRL